VQRSASQPLVHAKRVTLGERQGCRSCAGQRSPCGDRRHAHRQSRTVSPRKTAQSGWEPLRSIKEQVALLCLSTDGVNIKEQAPLLCSSNGKNCRVRRMAKSESPSKSHASSLAAEPVCNMQESTTELSAFDPLSSLSFLAAWSHGEIMAWMGTQ